MATICDDTAGEQISLKPDPQAMIAPLSRRPDAEELEGMRGCGRWSAAQTEEADWQMNADIKAESSSPDGVPSAGAYVCGFPAEEQIGHRALPDPIEMFQQSLVLGEGCPSRCRFAGCH